MSNSRKGITAKISNWVQKIKQKSANGNLVPDEPMSYDEYRKTVQLSSTAVNIKIISDIKINKDDADEAAVLF